jgi:glycosyltransferase involved in cell wall biosynthesis
VLNDITVVVIGWNQGRFLGDALRSVLPQVADPAQVVVVDNGSADETAAVAGAHPGVRYLYQANAGPSGARNAGLAQVATPFVLFLDADDMLATGALAQARAALADAPDAPLAYGGFCEVDEEGRLLFEAPVNPRGREFPGLLTGNHIAMHGTVLYRTEAVRAVGGFDPALRSCEDYDLYMKLAGGPPFATYDLIAARYRRHRDNATRDAAQMLRNALKVMHRHRPGPGAAPDVRAAYRQGLRFWRDYYGERLVGQMMDDVRRGRPARLMRNLALGLSSDPGLCARVLGRTAGRLLGSSSRNGDVRAYRRGDRPHDRQG